ncbi:hypothetical protein RI367_002192 [Sorochytrium milnesiophthora]
MPTSTSPRRTSPRHAQLGARVVGASAVLGSREGADDTDDAGSGNDAADTKDNTRLIPLANPKHVKLSCELCSKAAHVICPDCRLTYYWQEHQELDAQSIHTKICALLVPLRSPMVFLGSEQERARRDAEMKKRRIEVLELSRTEAQKFLFESRFSFAIPPALQALRFSLELYGSESTQLVPSYLLLGEASIGLKQYDQAEDYLSLAKWALLKAKSEESTTAISAHLHKNFGLLYLAKGNYAESVKNFALDIYYSSVLNGPNDIRVTGGYCQLGQGFWKQGRLAHTKSAFDKVVEIWTRFLDSIVDSDEQLDDAQQAECVQMFATVIEFRAQTSGTNTRGVAEASFTFARIYRMCMGDLAMAFKFAEQAQQLLPANATDALADTVRRFVQELQGQLQRRPSSGSTLSQPQQQEQQPQQQAPAVQDVQLQRETVQDGAIAATEPPSEAPPSPAAIIESQPGDQQEEEQQPADSVVEEAAALPSELELPAEAVPEDEAPATLTDAPAEESTHGDSTITSA